MAVFKSVLDKLTDQPKADPSKVLLDLDSS